MSDFYMVMPQLIRLPLLQTCGKKRRYSFIKCPLFIRPRPFFLFPKVKTFLVGRSYQSRQAFGSAIFQYLTSIPKSAYLDAFRKWIHRLKLSISSQIKTYVITNILNVPDYKAILLEHPSYETTLEMIIGTGNAISTTSNKAKYK